MRVVIDIPDDKVPDKQDILDLSLHFIDGTVCEAGGFGFQVLPEGHGNLIDADVLNRKMYHEAFETDSDMQKWDSGCWIRYKMFENIRDSMSVVLEADKGL